MCNKDSNQLKSILIIDDDPFTCDLLTAILKNTYNLTVVNDAIEGLKHIKENPPDLVLLDLMMPGKDGFEMMEEIKADPEICGTKICFISSIVDSESEQKVDEAGAAAFITKPFSKVELLQQISETLCN